MFQQTVAVELGVLFVSLVFLECIFPLKGTIARDTAVEKHTIWNIVAIFVFHGNDYAACNLVSKNNSRKNLLKLQ